MSTRENVEQEPLVMQEDDQSENEYDEQENQELVPLVLRILIAIILPMWLAMILSSLFFVTLRQMMHGTTMDRGFISRDLNIQITPLGFAASKNIIAVPSLFGESLRSPIFTPIMAIKDNACQKLNITFPEITRRQKIYTDLNKKIQGDFMSDFKDSDLIWTALIERGGCSFDEKVFRAEQAGFKNAIIYNNHKLPDVPVRMSSHIKGPFLKSHSMFTTRKNALELQSLLDQSSNNVLVVLLKPTHWGFLLDGNAFKDIAIRTLIRTFYTTIPLFSILFFSFGVALIRNKLLYNEWQVRETLEYILYEPSQAAPKLEKITFPSRILTADDCQARVSWKDGGFGIEQGCAICLEEFEAGNETRQLPCRHTFHSNCVDPWLLGHQRLCPICKRDVTE